MVVTFTKQNTSISSSTRGMFEYLNKENDDKKLFIVSAGNVRGEENWKNYPESNLNLSVENNLTEIERKYL